MNKRENTASSSCCHCYYANAHGGYSTCEHYNDGLYEISHDYGPKSKAREIASTCKHYKFFSGYDYKGCHGAYNPMAKVKHIQDNSHSFIPVRRIVHKTTSNVEYITPQTWDDIFQGFDRQDSEYDDY